MLFLPDQIYEFFCKPFHLGKRSNTAVTVAEIICVTIDHSCLQLLLLLLYAVAITFMTPITFFLTTLQKSALKKFFFLLFVPHHFLFLL